MGFEWMTITYSVMGKNQLAGNTGKSLPQKKIFLLGEGQEVLICGKLMSNLSAQFCYEPYITQKIKPDLKNLPSQDSFWDFFFIEFCV